MVQGASEFTIHFSVFLHLSKYVQFKEGAKSIRSSQAHTLSKLFPTFVFPEFPAEFCNKDKRPQLPEVVKLMENKRFLYDRDPVNAKAALEGHLRHPCILKASHLPLRIHSFHIAKCSADSTMCPFGTGCRYEWIKERKSA